MMRQCFTLLLEDMTSQADILSTTEYAVGSSSRLGLQSSSFCFQLARISDTGLAVGSESLCGAMVLVAGVVDTSRAGVLIGLGV